MSQKRRIEVKIQFKEVFAGVKRLEAIMIGQILSSVTGLATSWLDSNAQQKLLETEIKKEKDELSAIDYAEVLVV